MRPLAITGFTVTCAVGRGTGPLLQSLQNSRTGLAPADFPHCDLNTWTGQVDDVDTEELKGGLRSFDCRNNRLAQIGLSNDGFVDRVQDAIQRYGADRVGVVLGTSTSGIGATEQAYRNIDAKTGALPAFDYSKTHHIYSVVDFVRSYFELRGPGLMISTACSSSAKTFASGYRLMQGDLCDAVIIGGVDSLCLTTLYGFSSLELVSPTPCQPCAAQRNGLSLGEAAGFAVLERPQNVQGDYPAQLVGFGESSDAHHMSSPHPEGLGAATSMQHALHSAGLKGSDIDYINLHGTATRANDAMEDKAVLSVFGDSVPCSSTKGWTGHALGAAGIVEALISILCLQNDFIPGTLNTAEIDPELKCNIQLENKTGRINYVLSNSFGFGGSNCSLVFGKP